MLIKDIERYTIPIKGSFEASPVAPPEGTTVAELIQALQKLPEDGIVSTGFTSSEVVVMHYKPDIDSQKKSSWIDDIDWAKFIGPTLPSYTINTHDVDRVLGFRGNPDAPQNPAGG